MCRERFRRNIVLVIICFVLALLWINSTFRFRWYIVDKYIKEEQFLKAVNVYKKILRKRCINKKSNLIFHKLNKGTKDNIIEKKMELALKKHIQENFQEAVEFYKKKKFENALESYDRALFSVRLLFPVLKDKVFELTDIFSDEFHEPGANSIYKLYKLALRAGDSNLDRLKGINLLVNPKLKDKDNDNIPDGYSFADGTVRKGIVGKKVIVSTETENNIFNMWQRDMSGWFAVYFDLGRVPNNTFIVLSIEAKYINVIEHNPPEMYTVTDKSSSWQSGTVFKKGIVAERIEDGWQKESYVLQTKETDGIFLYGWIVSWQTAKGRGDTYVRNPKVEFGQEPTSWTDYLQ